MRAAAFTSPDQVAGEGAARDPGVDALPYLARAGLALWCRLGCSLNTAISASPLCQQLTQPRVRNAKPRGITGNSGDLRHGPHYTTTPPPANKRPSNRPQPVRTQRPRQVKAGATYLVTFDKKIISPVSLESGLRSQRGGQAFEDDG